MKVRYFLILLMLLALTACGGGNSGGSAFKANSPVSLLLTDAFSDQYSNVWVTVLQVTAQDAGGQTVSLYDNPAGNVVNLTELNGVATLLNTQNLPVGTYNNFQVKLADEVTLVDKMTSQSITAHFSGTGQPQTVPVSGQITIDTASNATIAIDFDLQQFSYDPNTGLVTPVLVLRQNPDQINRTVADIDGTVAQVLDNTSFQLQAEHSQSLIDISLQANATVFNAADGSVSSDTSTLQTAQRVSVYGNYDPVLMKLDAVRVEIQAAASSSSPAEHSDKVEGIVTAFDPNSGLLTLDIREATFIPVGTTLEIDLATSNPIFVKGSLDILAAGQQVEIRGNWQDPVFTPSIVEIEGGLPQLSEQGNDDNGSENSDSSNNHDATDHNSDTGLSSGNTNDIVDAYVDVTGEVQNVTDQLIQLTILEVDDETGASQQVGQTLDVDLSNAFFKRGDTTCLQAGDLLEAKGALRTDGVMDALVVEVERGCGFSTDSSQSTPDLTGAGNNPADTSPDAGTADPTPVI